MGRGMMLGIVEAIGELFGNLFTWLVNTLLVPVLTKVIECAVIVVKYVFASIFYEVSVFLLQLIDFIEMLFRSLAGLENNAGSTFFFSINGGEGDLLLQMLRSQEVLNAFYACCIVGVFLLIITTIFQMIKVEYTTEGAQNSKTTILGKSLKSVANLLLIPVLVIFGVFIGNQVLDLIDTATGGGSGTKISGVLFVTAASEAMLNEEGGDWLKVTDKAQFFGESIGFAISSIFDKEKQPNYSWGDPSDNRRVEVETNFMKCNKNYQYANLFNVIEHYNIYEINYLVLIFGACIIIKCLFFTAFGMIDRLYQCVALFIVSPMVVGMSPVKDSLGSWRSKFISKALSAYGSIIALNLFFIIVTVFLNIDITMNMSKDSILYFSTSFMTGLIKSIFVIVGCLMIEKLAGDLGGYFGGGNAMSDGKGLAGEATKGLATAAKVGTGLALGGAGIAAKLAKGSMGGGALIGGFKSKIAGGSFKEGAKEGFQNSFAAKGVKGFKNLRAEARAEKMDKRFTDALDANGIDKKAFSEYESNKMALENSIKQNEEKKSSAQARMDEASAILNDNYASKEQKEQAQSAYDSAKDDFDTSEKDLKSQKRTLLNDYSNSNFNDILSKKKSAIEAKDNLKAINEARDKRNHSIRDRVLTGANAISQIGRDGVGSMMPGPMKNAQKTWNDAIEKGNSYSDEGKQAVENLKSAKKDRQEAAYNNNWLNNVIISTNTKEQSQVLSKAIIERAEFKTSDLNDQMNSLIEKYKETFNKMQATPEADRNSASYKVMENNLASLMNRMQTLNPKVDFKGEQVINARIDMDLGSFKQNIEEAIKKNASKQDIDNIIKEQLKKWGETGNEQVLKEIRKAVEEIKNEVK